MHFSPRTVRIVAGSLLAVAALLVLLSIDWRPARPADPPTRVSAIAAEGALEAGAATVEIVPPFTTPMGGYATRGDAPWEGILDRPAARALAVRVGGRTVVLVSAELVVLPATLRRTVLAKLGDARPDELVVAATHTHSSLGGYWNTTVASVAGLGHYDPKIEEFLADRIAEAIRAALGKLAPARLASGRLEASHWAMNRNRTGGPVDDTLTAARIDALSGAPIARLVVYAAHPTILHRDHLQLSGDWPHYLMAELESESGAPTLFFQGAVGDATWGKRSGNMTLEDRVRRFGVSVAADARGALVVGGEGSSEVSLSFVRTRFALPPADAGGAVWGPFEPAASNLMHWVLSADATEASILHLGPLALAFVPGEVVAELGTAWRGLLDGATIVSLADDYVGYVETPDLVATEQGEAHRTYFGPDLAPVLLEGLRAAR